MGGGRVEAVLEVGFPLFIEEERSVLFRLPSKIKIPVGVDPIKTREYAVQLVHRFD